MPQKLKTPLSQTLLLGLTILELLAREQKEIGVRELARNLEIKPTTVHRLLKSLQSRGYVEQNDAGEYSIGPAVLHLAHSYTSLNPIAKIATKVFAAYRDRFEYNFYVGGVGVQFELIYLAVQESQGPIKIVVQPGSKFIGLHTTALGKVLLAYHPDQYIHEYIDQAIFTPLTDRSICAPETLWEEIHGIREQGYAINKGERFSEIGAVGVPIRDRHGRLLASLSLAYPQKLVEYGEIDTNKVLALARDIARDIGNY